MLSATRFSALTCLALGFAVNAAPSGASTDSRGFLDSSANLGMSPEALSDLLSSMDVAGSINRRQVFGIVTNEEQAEAAVMKFDRHHPNYPNEEAVIITSVAGTSTVYILSAETTPATTTTTSTSATSTAYTTTTSTQVSSTITATATATAAACDGLIGKIICDIDGLRTQAGNRFGGNANIGAGFGLDRLPVL